MKLLLVIMFASFLASCSSNSTKISDNNPDFDGDPGFTNPVEDPDNPVEEDRGYKLIDGVVYFDGEVLGTIETDMHGKQKVVDAEGNTIAHIEQTMSGYRIVIEHEGSGNYKDHYHIVKDGQGNWTVDWTNSIVDHGWGVDPDSIGKPEPASASATQRDAAKKKSQHLRSSINAKFKR